MPNQPLVYVVEDDMKMMTSKVKLRMVDLTKREREVMAMLVAGNNTKEIASRLKIGLQTVAKHRASVFKKMGVENAVKLVRLIAVVQMLDWN